jgi:hypothetical protein
MIFYCGVYVCCAELNGKEELRFFWLLLQIVQCTPVA